MLVTSDIRQFLLRC